MPRPAGPAPAAVADQLRNVGIEASVLALDPVALYTDTLVRQNSSLLHSWRPADDTPRLVAYSRRGDVVLADGMAGAGERDAAVAGQRRYRVRR